MSTYRICAGIVSVVIVFLELFIAITAGEQDPRDEKLPVLWGMSENELLAAVSRAESELKIHIYPIPDALFKPATNAKMSPAYELDRNFATYIREAEHNFDLADPRHNLLAKEANDANAFLIDHHSLLYRRCLETNCNGDVSGKNIYDHYLGPIISAVVDDNPYYNRNEGIDHFIMALNRKGKCAGQQEALARSELFTRIKNAHVFTNYGMDAEFEASGSPLKPAGEETCYMADNDIVVPQGLSPEAQTFHETYKMHNSFGILNREFDTSFAGNVDGDRKPLKKMAIHEEVTYFLNNTEDFSYDFSGGDAADKDLLKNGYFTYDACDDVCWSQRRYEAIAHWVIPILVGDGSIQAFERYIDWRKIAVKMSSDSWHNDDLLTKYRQKIRQETDALRLELERYREDLSHIPNTAKWGTMERMRRINHINEIKTNYSDPEFVKLLESPVMKKLVAIDRVSDWFNFNNKNGPKNPYRLMVLEMWCQIQLKKHPHKPEKVADICKRPPDFTARKEWY